MLSKAKELLRPLVQGARVARAGYSSDSESDLNGERPQVDVVARAVDQAIGQGHRSQALVLSRAARLYFPDNDRISHLALRSLLLEPTNNEDLVEAAELFWVINENNPQTFAFGERLTIAGVRCGDPSYFVDFYGRLYREHPNRSDASCRRVCELLRSCDEGELAGVLSRRLARWYKSLRPIALEMADETSFLELRRELDPADSVSMSGEIAIALARRAEYLNRHSEALDVLLASPPHRPAAFSLRVVSAGLKAGRFQDVLDFLDTTVHGLSEAALTNAVFDVAFALGHEDRAFAALEALPVEERGRAPYLKRYAFAHGDDATTELLNELSEAGNIKPVPHAELLMELNRPEDALEVLADLYRPGAAVRLSLSRCLYALRRFDEATLCLGPLRGTRFDETASKLLARIRLEQGGADQVVAERFELHRTGGFDEVLFHSLLSTEQLGDAFGLLPWPDDFDKLKTTFGSRAERSPTLIQGRRFVIMQGGPGDELQYSLLYHELSKLADETFVVTDPRMIAMLSRNIPSINFVSCTQSRVGTLGHSASEQNRSIGELHHLLDEAAMEIANSCDRVCFAKSIQQVLAPPTGRLGARAHLAPISRGRRAQLGPQRVGVVWRSEQVTAWRGIHYLKATDLAPLAELDAELVCLQHDVTDEERHVLKSVLPDLVYVDAVDLRDDFEESASLVSELDVVFGIGTTILNLAAAVGTRVVMAQPTHFGSWRLVGGDTGAGDDFWYESARVVVADPPWDRPQLLRRSVAEVQDQLVAEHNETR